MDSGMSFSGMSFTMIPYRWHPGLASTQMRDRHLVAAFLKHVLRKMKGGLLILTHTHNIYVYIYIK
jgi:hypothetical protein